MPDGLRERLDPHREGRTVWLLSSLLHGLYRLRSVRVRRFVRWAVVRLEGGNYLSWTIRRIFSQYHGVDVGMHTGRGCFTEHHFRHGTTIGRYTSIYPTAQAFNANHPMNITSTHSYFFNPVEGYTARNLITHTKLAVGNDVFIGHHAIILPSVSRIGDGAIIGAGAVVNNDVPPYAIVVGNPGRIVRYRFSEERIKELLASRWWEEQIRDLLPRLEDFQRPLEGQQSVR